LRIQLRSLLFLVACVILPSLVHAQDTFQVFGGFSYIRGSVPVTETILCPGPPCPVNVSTYQSNLNGWELSGTYKPGRWLGFTADFSGHYGTTQGAATHLQTFLLGPQVSLPGRVSPFAHLLVGGAYESVGSALPSSSAITIPASGTAFAAAAGERRGVIWPPPMR
jgi:hypothetical protein